MNKKWELGEEGNVLNWFLKVLKGLILNTKWELGVGKKNSRTTENCRSDAEEKEKRRTSYKYSEQIMDVMRKGKAEILRTFRFAKKMFEYNRGASSQMGCKEV